MQKSSFLAIGAVLGMCAVILGAFGAHGLEKLVDARQLQRFHTGVEYQFYHALALVLVGLLQMHFTHRLLDYAGYAFIVGTLLFSGSLYLYVMTGIVKIAMITPIGGVAFILGWLFFALAVQRRE
jgi:uncharacterized membrane protein YgdD (TMEM256/DUF423 family)